MINRPWVLIVETHTIIGGVPQTYPTISTGGYCRKWRVLRVKSAAAEQLQVFRLRLRQDQRALHGVFNQLSAASDIQMVHHRIFMKRDRARSTSRIKASLLH